ncbi:MAG: nucleoside 2-deoxyribosyltransferase [Candidatus Devosia phytovorans]|uniref:Nucleoside 2-deoxyribosyltransferase n=1 Tax=Candidatus Devosia phytovorans TaxID=3121372 RepID=A0AAJ6B3K6_9HYPH|nr:nucleoside 2-deoxyribosyltransferase [Devosia sp.]WEK06548.1 MAG: nucleoside 2-deoxyribosyltransferase [Devosia sp.]
MSPTHKVYIAGPEVFLPNGFDQMRIKGEMALAEGFFPSTMAENDLDPTGATPFEFGRQISAANEKMMRDADFCIANLTPFRGISADVGTGYEVGFMIALGKPVFGYTNTSKLYYDRLLEDYYGSKAEKDAQGVLRGADGLMIEDHGMVDNLMYDGGIAAIGGQLVRRDVAPDQLLTDLGAYQECLKLARELFDAR